jgi:hypothetical protein
MSQYGVADQSMVCGGHGDLLFGRERILTEREWQVISDKKTKFTINVLFMGALDAHCVVLHNTVK